MDGTLRISQQKLANLRIDRQKSLIYIWLKGKTSELELCILVAHQSR